MSRNIHCPECGAEISGDNFSADAMRRRFFACLRDAHANLKDEHRQRWPNPEALRKAALIAVGHCDSIQVVVGSRAAAPGVANAFRMKDEHRQRWPNPEALRKAALIAVGHCDSIQVVVGSRAAAPGVANAFRMKDQYCLATTQGDVVTIYTARSMARRVLPKKQFLEVAEAVFGYIASRTGIDPSRSLSGEAA